MPNKLTDKEIVKALECCINDKPCKKTKCPLYENGCDIDIFILEKYSLDLINRLQAQIEKLEKVEHFADKTIAILQAENERLNNLTLEKCCDNCIHEEKTLQADPCCECFGHNKFTPKNFLNLIKAEAYKEFAEKLEERIAVKFLRNKSNEYAEGFADALDGVNGELNNILKELVGD